MAALAQRQALTEALETVCARWPAALTPSSSAAVLVDHVATEVHFTQADGKSVLPQLANQQPPAPPEPVSLTPMPAEEQAAAAQLAAELAADVAAVEGTTLLGPQELGWLAAATRACNAATGGGAPSTSGAGLAQCGACRRMVLAARGGAHAAACAARQQLAALQQAALEARARPATPPIGSGSGMGGGKSGKGAKKGRPGNNGSGKGRPKAKQPSKLNPYARAADYGPYYGAGKPPLPRGRGQSGGGVGGLWGQRSGGGAVGVAYGSVAAGGGYPAAADFMAYDDGLPHPGVVPKALRRPRSVLTRRKRGAAAAGMDDGGGGGQPAAAGAPGGQPSEPSTKLQAVAASGSGRPTRAAARAAAAATASMLNGADSLGLDDPSPPKNGRAGGGSKRPGGGGTAKPPASKAAWPNGVQLGSGPAPARAQQPQQQMQTLHQQLQQQQQRALAQQQHQQHMAQQQAMAQRMQQQAGGGAGGMQQQHHQQQHHQQQHHQQQQQSGAGVPRGFVPASAAGFSFPQPAAQSQQYGMFYQAQTIIQQQQQQQLQQQRQMQQQQQQQRANGAQGAGAQPPMRQLYSTLPGGQTHVLLPRQAPVGLADAGGGGVSGALRANGPAMRQHQGAGQQASQQAAMLHARLMQQGGSYQPAPGGMLPMSVLGGAPAQGGHQQPPGGAAQWHGMHQPQGGAAAGGGMVPVPQALVPGQQPGRKLVSLNELAKK